MNKKSCKKCNKTFTIEDRDFKFYERLDVLEPTHCPDCRQQRRISHRTRNYHLRQCDLCQKNTMSMYASEIKGYKFYCNDCFQSDKWDGFEYGRDFDFSKTFFEQFNELYKIAPKHISNTIKSDNSEYIINAHQAKNCYMLDEVDFSENCFYGYCLQYCKECVDCLYANKCEIGYELIKCEHCYNCNYAFNSHNCTDCSFIANSRGCANCLFCTNLRNAENHLFNKPASKEEIEKARKKYFTGNAKDLEKGIEQYKKLIKKMIVPNIIGTKNENCSGNYLVNNKDCLDSYGLDNSENCRFCYDMHYSKDCYDVYIYVSELSYECLHAGPDGYHQIGCHLCWYGNNIFYCDECHSCQDCFACASLKKQKHCVMNKQYTKHEFDRLVEKIKAHMKETEEWGQYFPAKYSAHSYDQTYAQEFFPLKKQEAINQGFNWIDQQEKQYKPSEVGEIPDNIDDFKEADLNKVFECEKSKKYFKITKQELEFYKKYNLSLPKFSPEVRLSEKFKQTGHRKVWHRTCMKPGCNNDFETSYSPSDTQIVYCEECYKKEVY